MKAARRVLFGLLTAVTAAGLLFGDLDDAGAQPRKPAAGPRAPAKKPPLKPDDPDAAITAPLAGKEDPAPTLRDAGSGKGAVVLDQKTLDGGARVFRFGEVEVEGRLKSPQIVYFLRRVRAEFAAGDLGHRSFMSELGETKNEPSF